MTIILHIAQGMYNICNSGFWFWLQFWFFELIYTLLVIKSALCSSGRMVQTPKQPTPVLPACQLGSTFYYSRIEPEQRIVEVRAREPTCIGVGLAGSGCMARRIRRQPSAVNQVAAARANWFGGGLLAAWRGLPGSGCLTRRIRQQPSAAYQAAAWQLGAAYQAYHASGEHHAAAKRGLPGAARLV